MASSINKVNDYSSVTSSVVIHLRMCLLYTERSLIVSPYVQCLPHSSQAYSTRVVNHSPSRLHIASIIESDHIVGKMACSPSSCHMVEEHAAMYGGNNDLGTFLDVLLSMWPLKIFHMIDHFTYFESGLNLNSVMTLEGGICVFRVSMVLIRESSGLLMVSL